MFVLLRVLLDHTRSFLVKFLEANNTSLEKRLQNPSIHNVFVVKIYKTNYNSFMKTILSVDKPKKEK